MLYSLSWEHYWWLAALRSMFCCARANLPQNQQHMPVATSRSDLFSVLQQIKLP